MAACDRALPQNFPAVAVIGGGNLGITSAAYVAARGGSSSLFIRPSARGVEKLDALTRHGNSMLLTPPDAAERTVHLDKVAASIGDAVAGRKLIFVTTPADGHVEVAEGLAKHLEPGMCIVLHPGKTYGAFAFLKTLKDAGADPAVLDTISIAELNSSIFTTRSTVQNARYSALKGYMLFSCFPASKTSEVLPPLRALFPTSRFEVLDDALAMAFHPIGSAPHTLITLTHLGDLAHGKSYEFYTEGVDQHNAKLIEAFDAERCAVAKAYGYTPVSFADCLRRMYRHEYVKKGLRPEDLTVQQLLNENGAYKGYGSPTSIDTRYFTEEIPCGVKPLTELAERVSVPTPVIGAVRSIVDALFAGTERSLDPGVRTLRSLDLDDLSVEQLREYARTGERPER